MTEGVLIVMIDMDSVESENPRNKSLKRVLGQIIQTELTNRQRQVFLAYHVQGLQITQIANQLGVNKSTVSRTLMRAEQKVGRFAKYL